jgi:small subunit ribosomal protein S1
MVENKGTINQEEDMMDRDEELEDAETFAELLDSTHKALKPGEVVKGIVVQKNPDSVVVDVGYKSEGIVSLNEFGEDAGSIQVGSEFDVLFEGTDNETGLVRLSKRKADQQKIWNGLEEDAVVDGRILSRIKGGLSVDIGVNAFLPGSQVDLRPVRNLEKARQYRVVPPGSP